MTREDIKNKALDLVAAGGLINLSRVELCKAAEIPIGSFSHIMGCSFTEFIQELQRAGVSSGNHPVNKTRTDPDLRKAQILETAVGVAKELGYLRLSRKNIGEAAGVSDSLIGYYFPTIGELRRAVMGQAVRHEIPEIIAQGLAEKDELAIHAPAELKSRAVQTLIKTA